MQLSNTPGAAAAAPRQLVAAGVNINYAFASVPSGHAMTVLVVAVDDAQRAAAAAGM